LTIGPARLDTIEPAYNRQYANSPDKRAYGYAELAVSSQTVVVTIASTHCTYPHRNGQAEWD